MPPVVLLDEHRRILWAHEGYPGNEALESAIRKVVGEPKQPAGGAEEPAPTRAAGRVPLETAHQLKGGAAPPR